MTQTVPPVRLDDLIAAVASAHEDPLERVARAVALGMRLDDMADSLIDHFVDQARRSGASWTEIGRSLGVTKQAAQKRFSVKAGSGLDASQGFSRFTDPARRAVVAAQTEARAAGNDGIAVAHLILGLLTNPDCAAAALIAGQGIDLDLVRQTARATLPPSAGNIPALIPFDQHARDALDRTFAEAERAGHEQVGTEHMLMAILAVEDGTGVLAGLGLRADEVELGLGEQPH
jgi:hypothetical protein